MAMRDNLILTWQAVLNALGVAPDRAARAAGPWLALHEGPDRHYHTAWHVFSMTRMAAMLSGLYTPMHSSPILLTCFFHDCVYDPRAKDNEEQSAVRAEAFLHDLGMDEGVIARTSELILVTKTHEPADDLAAAVVCDADLNILSANPMDYDDYAADIRKEYAFVSDDAYRRGRLAVLEGFLARPTIYRLPIMASLNGAEYFARVNLEHEIKTLRASSGEAD